MIGKPPGQEDPSFRCLACRTTFRNCPISKMRDHLDTRTSGGTCPKLTIYMQVCFNEGETQKGNTVPKHHGEGGTCFFTDIITSLLNRISYRFLHVSRF
jgi:hypothetical protein